MANLENKSAINVSEVTNKFYSDKLETFETYVFETKEQLKAYAFEPFSIVISLITSTGKYKVCNFGRATNNNELTIVKEMFKYVLAETKQKSDFDAKHSGLKISNKVNIKPFLKAKVAYITDKDGKIGNNLVVSEIPFKDTGMNIGKNHELITQKLENKEIEAALILRYCKAFVWQFKKLSMLKDNIMRYTELFDMVEIDERIIENDRKKNAKANEKVSDKAKAA